MNYSLPTALEVGGQNLPIRSDYRAALDICAALSDPELSKAEAAQAALIILYPTFRSIPPQHYRQAVEQCFWFLDCGEEAGPKSPKVIDWEQDFRYIVAPVNRVIGQEIRAMEYLHWWTFMAAFHELGDCLFAQIVRIRDQKARGKKLEKHEQEWYQRNRQMVDFRQTFTGSEKEAFKAWGA